MPNISSIFHHHSSQPLRILDIHCLDIAVQLLLCTFLVVSLSRYPDTQSIRDTLNPGFPDFLVELRIEADVFSSLIQAAAIVSEESFHHLGDTQTNSYLPLLS